MNSNRRDDSPLYAAMVLFALLLALMSSVQTPRNEGTVPANSDHTTKETPMEASTEAEKPDEVESVKPSEEDTTPAENPGDSTTAGDAIPGAVVAVDVTQPDSAADTNQPSGMQTVLNKVPVVADVAKLVDTLLPQVTDYSYFRLAQQHQAQLIPGLDDFTAWSFSREVLPDACQFNSDDNELFCFSEAQLAAEPGTIISALDCGTAEVIISVPVLPEALQEFIDQRGERCLMSYAQYEDDNNNVQIEAEVLVYSGTPEIIINPQQEIYVANLYNDYKNAIFYTIQHVVYRSESGVSDTLVVSDAAMYCYMGTSPTQDIDREYPYTCLASYLNGKSIEEFANSDTLALGVSECTPTSFTSTAAQIERLIAGVQEFEARPLPEKFLAYNN